MDQHAAWLQLLAITGCLIGLEVLRERLSELKRDPAAHHTNAIDGVDQGLSIGLQDVAMFELNHA